jgi:hypothetical protein
MLDDLTPVAGDQQAMIDMPLPPDLPDAQQVRLTAPLIISNHNRQQTLGLMQLVVRDKLWATFDGKAAS